MGIQGYTRVNRGIQGYLRVHRGIQGYKRVFKDIQGCIDYMPNASMAFSNEVYTKFYLQANNVYECKLGQMK